MKKNKRRCLIMINLTYALEQIQDLTNTAVEEMGEKIGHMYVGWYLTNGPRIISEWTGEKDLNELNIDWEQHSGLLQRLAEEFDEWLERE
jgi:hypothetical protein